MTPKWNRSKWTPSPPKPPYQPLGWSYRFYFLELPMRPFKSNDLNKTLIWIWQVQLHIPIERPIPQNKLHAWAPEQHWNRSEHLPPQTSLSAFRLILSILFSWIAYASVQVQRSKQKDDLDLASSIAHTYWTSDSAEQVACLSSRATQFASLKIRRLQRQVAFVNLIQVFVRLIGPARLGPRPNLEPSDLDSEKKSTSV